MIQMDGDDIIVKTRHDIHRVFKLQESYACFLLLLRPVIHSSSFRIFRMSVVTNRCDRLNHGPLPASALLPWLPCGHRMRPQSLTCSG